jgi:hypothetical protein
MSIIPLYLYLFFIFVFYFFFIYLCLFFSLYLIRTSWSLGRTDGKPRTAPQLQPRKSCLRRLFILSRHGPCTSALTSFTQSRPRRCRMALPAPPSPRLSSPLACADLPWANRTLTHDGPTGARESRWKLLTQRRWCRLRLASPAPPSPQSSPHATVTQSRTTINWH